MRALDLVCPTCSVLPGQWCIGYAGGFAFHGTRHRALDLWNRYSGELQLTTLRDIFEQVQCPMCQPSKFTGVTPVQFEVNGRRCCSKCLAECCKVVNAGFEKPGTMNVRVL